MFRLLWDKILALFGKQQNNANYLIEAKDKFTIDYENTRDINITSIFSNKLANYAINDSTIDLKGDDLRTELLNKTLKKLKRQLKRIISREIGTGGCLVIPFVANNKIYFNIVSQNRLNINKKIGDDIVDCTIMAEKIVRNQTNYYRWADYTLENGVQYIRYRATKEADPIPMNYIEEWANIEDKVIPNVDRMLFMYLKSPIDNRHENNDYGVPITFGCEKQVRDIKHTLDEIIREFDLKEAFVGADVTMFASSDGKRDGLPSNGLYKKVNAGEDNFWEIFSPDIRDSSYYNKLMQQCAILEKQVGTSRGILTDPLSTYQNTNETRRALYDTFSLVDDIRDGFAEGLDDFIYACDVLANYYNLVPMGNYELVLDWDYSMIDDSTTQWNQLVQGKNLGVIEEVELRQWIKPEETVEEAQEVIDRIKENNPKVEDLLGE